MVVGGALRHRWRRETKSNPFADVPVLVSCNLALFDPFALQLLQPPLALSLLAPIVPAKAPAFNAQNLQ
jgi:hypothetical protein